MYRFTLVALAAGLMACAGAASANDTYNGDTNQKEVKVTFTNAQLSDPAQAKPVYAELYKAAQKACDSDGIGPDWRRADDQLCESEAMAGALKDLHRPALSALYAETVEAPHLARAERPAARGSR